jgi:RimJ/RimL family protein N-acetyltransferase
MTIRRLDPSDWARFREIRLDMLRAAPRAFGSTEAEWAEKPEREIRDWLARMHTLALFDGPRILGTAAVHRRPGSRADHRAEVIAVYLRPEARGQGQGAALLAGLAAAARAEGVLQLELEVATWNTAAIAAYERAGFVRVGLMPRAMRDGARFVDDLIMVLPLDSR